MTALNNEGSARKDGFGAAKGSYMSVGWCHVMIFFV